MKDKLISFAELTLFNPASQSSSSTLLYHVSLWIGDQYKEPSNGKCRDHLFGQLANPARRQISAAC